MGRRVESDICSLCYGRLVKRRHRSACLFPSGCLIGDRVSNRQRGETFRRPGRVRSNGTTYGEAEPFVGPLRRDDRGLHRSNAIGVAHARFAKLSSAVNVRVALSR
ncbi:hypothetical protein D0U02_10280 [Burkholderia pseudomallei]|uniref:Uncharacterized protein n=2 Tax=Burkholderia pseudomallei TaxID=28450 RepID=A0A0H3HU75_BURP2|nr:hypothetical protein BP1026B_II0128 [Burkholderia pseudomallei 1026b]ARK58314.1 hypothetical protein BOC36_22820 [Burkholderia pseudomallei]EIF61495.1 hypothetical protein BP1258A_2918 [Burkholderia pseudomallei 1258a]EIF62270.1 hypothetical protein BP1258B_3292 [Burkholderia pseudomallei 1258b]EIF63407.1 hypothetical protein BP1026A_1817 [Burkholderia pseudomallei 1026a]EIF68403.1 hypothetical protein BP354E_6147 [Burkholderia pseudomallei 354e]EIF79333.1 hypothetical protein BP354A_3424 